MRTRLLDWLLLREVLVPLGVGLLAIVQLLVLVQLLQLNEVVFGGAVTLPDLARVTLGLLPHFLVMALPLAFVLGVQLGLGRLSANRELLALASVGRGPGALYRVPVAVALVLSLGVAWLVRVAEPWGMRELNAVLNDVIKRNVEQGLKPGIFNDGLPRFMVYVSREEQGPGGKVWKGVLIEDRVGDGAPMLALAEEGRVVEGAGATLGLELSRGELHRMEEKGDEKGEVKGETRVRFESARFLVGVQERVARKNRLSGSEVMFTDEELEARAVQFAAEGQLDKAARARLERARRVTAPLACLAFVLLAVPLAVRSAGGRGLAYLVVLGSFAVFYVLGRVALVGAERGLPAFAMSLLPTAVIAVLGLALSALLLRRGVELVR